MNMAKSIFSIFPNVRWYLCLIVVTALLLPPHMPMFNCFVSKFSMKSPRYLFNRSVTILSNTILRQFYVMARLKPLRFCYGPLMKYCCLSRSTHFTPKHVVFTHKQTHTLSHTLLPTTTPTANPCLYANVIVLVLCNRIKFTTFHALSTHTQTHCQKNIYTTHSERWLSILWWW